MDAIIFFIILIHIKTAIFSMYVHRGIGHKLISFHPAVEHFFRFYLWFVWGWGWWPRWKKNYATHHRKHHKFSDTDHDPHSPNKYTWLQMIDSKKSVLPGHAGYVSREDEIIFAQDTELGEDKIWKNLYNKYPKLGQTILWIIATYFFGLAGFIGGAINYFLINIISITLTNWAFHQIGFHYADKNKPKGSTDKSRIVFPWGIFLAGEELHAHHHTDASTPYFHRNWWEIDLSWGYMLLLEKLGLATINHKH